MRVHSSQNQCSTKQISWIYRLQRIPKRVKLGNFGFGKKNGSTNHPTQQFIPLSLPPIDLMASTPIPIRDAIRPKIVHTTRQHTCIPFYSAKNNISCVVHPPEYTLLYTIYIYTYIYKYVYVYRSSSHRSSKACSDWCLLIFEHSNDWKILLNPFPEYPLMLNILERTSWSYSFWEPV